ncbi:MAG: 3-oxoadipate enol-lactonase [Albidovulum sp.]|nr:3-oxoadipate enol-lactonase [Albidovulum sp.]MDE0305062.1 3-oxoadipate enol-lactonase [Albidovulum sp.]
MKMMRVGNVAIHYADEGDPNGLPVVFSNSLGTDFRVWDRVVGRLPKELRLVRYDTRGHGLSTITDQPFAVSDLALDAAGLMDRLKISLAVFVGLSIGGVTALQLASTRPDLVSAVVLSNTAARIGSEDMWRSRIDAIAERGVEAVAEGVLERWFSKSFREKKHDELEAWRSMLCRTTAAGYLGCCESLRTADLSDAARNLLQPTLAIAGSEDGATPPRIVEETASLIPNCKFRRIDGAGHLPCVEKSEEYAALIGDFFSEVGSAGRRI